MTFKDLNETEKQLPSQFVAKEREKLKNTKMLFLGEAVDYSGIFGFHGGGSCLVVLETKLHIRR
jgi:hypothetical protein